MNKAMALPVRAVRQSATKLGASPYIAAVFLSAALVFLVQPMFAKMATPLLGGAPNVWNVSLVCFQAALLLGYAYAHLLNHFVTQLRTQVGIHMGLLVLAALVLPFQLSGALGDPDPTQPTFWLIGVFALSIAPPFAIIAATAPLIQSWYSRSGRADAHDPYHLYGASNIGSLIGLVIYPLVLEPLFPIATQTFSWSLGYGVLALLLIGSGWSAIATGGGQAPAIENSEVLGTERIDRGLWQQRLWWLACAFVPSSLLVGVTTHISTDIASVPFLWALPLILYISSFIIVFSKQPMLTLPAANRLLPFAVAMAAFALFSNIQLSLFIAIPIHLLTLFLAAMVGHGVMASDRPAANRLTEFYLIMSLGGVLGGAFNALLVPVIFDSVIEYPLMLLAILALRPGLRWMGQGRTRVWSIAAVAALVAACVLNLNVGNNGSAQYTYRFIALIAIAAIVFSKHSKLGPVIAAMCTFGISALANPSASSIEARSFFGVVKILEIGEFRLLQHGTTQHGAQFLAPESALIPTTYYAKETPIGQVFSTHKKAGNVGIVGLGTGSVACYAQPDQNYVYYEIDPLVAKFAKDPQYFSYLSECTPDAPVILGDGRLSLAAEPAETFDLLLIDAFSSDSVPAHLLTVEAVDLYLSRLSEDGVLVMHISNRHMDLSKIVARIAERLGVPALYQFYIPTKDVRNVFAVSPSQVAVLAKSEDALKRLESNPNWAQLDSDGKRAWSDDYSNVVGAMLAGKD
ncbi:MAG: fused MFS/spermidine synthase [Pseudomonadota bacterium]